MPDDHTLRGSAAKQHIPTATGLPPIRWQERAPPLRPNARVVACRAMLDHGDTTTTTFGTTLAAMLEALTEAGRFDEAVSFAAAYPRAPGSMPRWDALLVRALTRAGHDEVALERVEAALRQAPGNLVLGQQRFDLLARLHRHDAATALLGELMLAPHFRFNPPMIKLLRQQFGAAHLFDLTVTQPCLFRPGDLLECRVDGLLAGGRIDEALALMDIDRLLDRRADLIEIDHALLAQEITALPRAPADPQAKASQAGLDMGVIAGAAPRIAAVLAAAEHAVNDYRAAAIRRDSAFVAASPVHARMKAWTVTFAAGGRALPHNHPAGWLSGVFYVATPGTDEDAGALVVPLAPPEIEPAPWRPRVLVPRAGELILFPSFYRHHTLAHDSADPRISIAFDVMSLDQAA